MSHLLSINQIKNDLNIFHDMSFIISYLAVRQMTEQIIFLKSDIMDTLCVWHISNE